MSTFIKVVSGRKSLSIPVKRTGFFRRGLGLMFRSSNTDNLLFEFSRDSRWAITSWFVFFPFIALWIDKNNVVQEISVVRPFVLSFKPKKPFRKLVEIPFNSKNSHLTRFFVGK